MKTSITDFPDDFYKGKKVLVRVDFNVPISNGEVDDDFRIRSTIHTLEYLSRRGAKIIIISHLGRPKGKPESYLSLKPVISRLKSLLPEKKVDWIDDCIGSKVENKIQKLQNGEILLLENLRFHSEEEKNDEKFAQSLASYAEIFVNDAFSVSHRKHASVYGVPTLLQYRLAGLQLQKELKYLMKIRDEPEHPFVLVIGGAKIRDKIDAVKRLIDKAEKVLVGGAIAYTFLASKGYSVGKSPVEDDYISWAAKILEKEEKIILPEDHFVASNIDERNSIQLVGNEIPSDMIGFDIGPKTSQNYMSIISSTNGTVFWNGPMGLFEIREFSHGTMDIVIATILARLRGAETIVGGGDSVSALRKIIANKSEVSHISTGGGASLEYIGGKVLPGIEILKDK
ncbi:phosphoglycerate kinase [Candidatus Bathyarchaeota archaeon RBG_13_38_9]|nr:MAG: phosphoglycerate kinase [Candidatus Bathyarchaeota archaeon RBG_13_38_9]